MLFRVRADISSRLSIKHTLYALAVAHFRTDHDAIIGALELVASPLSSLNALEKAPVALTLHAPLAV